MSTRPARAAAACTTLAAVREEIDRIDRDVIALLAERSTYVARAGTFKRNVDEVRAPDRAAQVIANAGRMAADAGADPRVIERIYRELVAAFTDYEISSRKS